MSSENFSIGNIRGVILFILMQDQIDNMRHVVKWILV